MNKLSRQRPLGYDAKREKYILFDDILSGKEKIVPVESLSNDDLKKLVIERWRVLPEDTTIQAVSGPPLKRDELIQLIERDEPFGQIIMEAEKSYLVDLLNEIRRELE